MDLQRTSQKNFHVYSDAELGITLNGMKLFILQERDVSYRCYPHFHPYVGQLLQRLLQKSTSGLQASDTEYHTRVRLSNATAAKDSEGQAVQLRSGETVNLLDSATATLEDGSVIVFAAGKVLKPEERPIKPARNTPVTVRRETVVRRANGTLLKLDNDAAAMLVDGTPRPVMYADIFSPSQYNPSALVPEADHPAKDLDFSSSGAYSAYNWELFFHVPITIAIHLSKNQRFAEAQQWFHYLFDPTDDSAGPTPERFWKVKPFQYTDVKKIEEILGNLATDADPKLRKETIRSIEAWEDAPFRPHVIARVRQQAYMYKAVMAYLDNLIAWGDSLFRQDTGEAIDEAMIVYVLAANILGPRPQLVPTKGSVRPQTYNNLRDDLEKFGSVMRDLEPDTPFDSGPFPAEASADNNRLATLRSLGKALYFCVPRNDKLLGYWDTVADRLFKIRNSLNMQGIFRQLALFEPAIDPALLARATAAGLDVGAIVNGLNQPLPLVRFPILIQKAAEICQEVKSLGNNLLSAMEKEDNEALAILRAKHENSVIKMVEQVKYGQVQDATKSKEGLLNSLALAVQRYTYYERQLGKQPGEIDGAIAAMGAFDKEALAKMKLVMQEPEIVLRPIEVDIAKDLNESGGKVLSTHEAQELVLLKEARAKQHSAAVLDHIAGLLATVPNFGASFQPFGVGGTISFGGSNLSAHFSLFSNHDKAQADQKSYESLKAAKIGTHANRQQDWAFQSNLAAGEINQIAKQIRAAEIREAVAELELKNHQQQMKYSEEIEHFLNEEGAAKNGKKTNKALYAWTKREVKGLYGQSFQFAFDIARKAERALQHELGDSELSYLQFGYLAGKEGLMAGEKLYVDIKRMDMAYHNLNQREYELTKHVSLMQVDSVALLQLRTTGSCTVRLPETLFDMDGPGHYFRRIKTVAVSIPSVTGPYTSVNCTLTLLKSSIRKTQVLRGDVYAREDSEDDRFNDYFGSLQSIVTSSAQNDTGMFETNLRDERYLPFENSGVVSEWRLELPANPSNGDPLQFDYDTISDVILHLRYTAREGGALLRKGAVENVKAAIAASQAAGSVRLLSIRHEFPTEWARFKSTRPVNASSPAKLTLKLREEHYPFWSKDRLGVEADLEIFAKIAEGKLTISGDSGSAVILEKGDTFGHLGRGKLPKLPPIGKLSLNLSDNSITDLWLALTWGNNE